MAHQHTAEGLYIAVLRQLADVAWAPGSRLPGTRRLAREMRTSHIAVQTALRRAARHGLLDVRQRHPVTVKPDAPEKARHLLGRLLTRSTTHRVAILVPDTYLPEEGPFELYYATLTDRLVAEAARRDLEAKLERLTLDDQVAAAASLPRQGYSAAVFLGFGLECLPSVVILEERRFPLVVFNRRIRGLKLITVRLADYAATQRVADHFVSHGHRNLCFVTHPSVATPYGRLERISGWVEYLRRHDLYESCSSPVHILPTVGYTTVYDRAFVDLLHGPNRPTAILFAAGAWARPFLTDPRFADLRVPEDFSLATFEPTQYLPAVPWSPPLTTICTSHERTAECVIETVQKMLKGEPHPPNIRVPMEINLTDSIGPAPSGVRPRGRPAP